MNMPQKLRFNKYERSFIIIIAFLISVSTTGCSQDVKKSHPADTSNRAWDKTIPGNFSSQSTAVFDSTQLITFLKQYPKFNEFAGNIKSFYRKRDFAYAWYDKGVIIEQAGNLTNRVLNIQNEGIYTGAPYTHQLDSLFYKVNAVKNKPDIQLELMLTSQYFAFSKVAWEGLDNSASRAAKWYVPRKKVSYEDYLDSLLKAPSLSAPVDEPVYRQYELLKNYLGKYRELDKADSWQPIISKTILKSGDSSAVIPLVKSRLFKLGYYRGDTTKRLFDGGLMASVKKFQGLYGLTINGRLDKATFSELNVPVKDRIEQIIVNMERSRWLPVKLDGDYLAVNIPEFKLHVYHGDSLLWSCNVVVGKTMHETVIFYGEVQYVVFSPYWNVPPSIVRNEILPKMKKNPNYLANQRMEITGSLNGLPVVRQKPGPTNSLGLVKFLFPNTYNIYLHDTPSKALFEETSRNFSHGCIRVKEPVKLANFLLKDRPEWTAANIDKAMHASTEKTVTLKPKVPVFIAYLTAFVDRDNEINFRKDIYNHDDKLAAMLVSAKGAK
ncbi:MAG TPA: L,D-transpeptidase family protein [Mucilaginibacter sp.]